MDFGPYDRGRNDCWPILDSVVSRPGNASSTCCLVHRGLGGLSYHDGNHCGARLVPPTCEEGAGTEVMLCPAQHDPERSQLADARGFFIG